MNENKIILMKRCFLTIIIFLTGYTSYGQNNERAYIIKKGNVAYDFTFAELAVKYLETDDSTYLQKIADLKATEHIINHARRYKYNVPRNSKIELVRYLLSPVNEKKKLLPDFKRNLQYAKKNVAEIDLAQKECLKYLPDSFHYSSNLFYTFGYDLGVVYGENASVNLAHPYYLKNMNEIRYYSIHELHHAGFVTLKNFIMPSSDITSYKEMTQFIEYFTHLEGMGTFAPLDLRKKENAMNIDKDYIALQDSALMKDFEKEYFEIYFHFKNNPNTVITETDWDMVSILSDKKRLWYRVGAHMAETIYKKLGKEKLGSLIAEPSENFINTYLSIKGK